jgi:hypothetical protein
MAQASVGNHSRSLKTYMTTDTFFNNIRVYESQSNTTTLNKEGRLTTPGTAANITTVALRNVSTGANLVLADCPAGRFLRETGKRLFPGIHPGLTMGDKYNGAVVGYHSTQTTWVYVIDSVTGCSFYINPNDSVFSVYSYDKSFDIDSHLEDIGSVSGAAVLTLGNVRSLNPVVSLGTVAAATTTLDVTVSRFFTLFAAANIILDVNSTPLGATLTFLITFSGNWTVTFAGARFLGAGIHTIAGNGQTFMITFIGDGNRFIEVSRTGALS